MATFPDTQINQHTYPKKFLADLFRQMVCIREFEERAQELYSRTTIPGISHLSCGQEAVAVGVCAALRPDDYITSTHRGHGHCLAKGADLGRMFAELFGKVDGYCRGKGGSMHIANQDRGNLGANAIVGGGIPIATGAGLSCKLRETDQVSVCFFGDGALNQGVLLESMNMASIWRLPVVFVCENNQYGEYTPTAKVTAGNIPARGEALGIPSAAVDGMNVLEVYEAASEAVLRARDGLGPGFLVFETYRYYGHGMSDRNRPYRSREEENDWRQNRDPNDHLARFLIASGQFTEADLAEVGEDVRREIESAVAFAEQSAFPDPEDVSRHIYAD